MAINIENVRDSLYRQTSLSDKTVQYECGSGFQKNPKEIRHRIGGKLYMVIRWDYAHDHNRLGGGYVFIEGPSFHVLECVVWGINDKITPHKLVLAAKKMMNEFAANLTNLAKRPKGE